MATSSSVAALAAMDAEPPTAIDLILAGARIKAIPFTYEKVAGNTAGDRIQMWRVHKSWAVLSIKLANDALSGLDDANIGLFSDETVGSDDDVDENVYADDIDLTSSLAWAEQAFEARDLAKLGQKVWQDAGAATEQAAAEYYRICLNIIAASTATGTISGILLVAVPGG